MTVLAIFGAVIAFMVVCTRIGFLIGWTIWNRKDPFNWRVLIGPGTYFNWLDARATTLRD